MSKTKLKILKAGIKLWKRNPDDVKALRIAKEIKMVHATVLYHFPHDSVKNAVAEYAVETGEKVIVAQLIATGHPAIKDMPQDLRQSYLSSI